MGGYRSERDAVLPVHTSRAHVENSRLRNLFRYLHPTRIKPRTRSRLEPWPETRIERELSSTLQQLKQVEILAALPSRSDDGRNVRESATPTAALRHTLEILVLFLR